MERIRARRFLPFGSPSSAETVKLRTRKSKLYRKENNAISRVHGENLHNRAFLVKIDTLVYRGRNVQILVQ